ncbi:MAG: pilus assembly FimT family protein [Clostridia bacterium]|jgi:prepilin-type N-terminal cleavage/methylation domain-containing protein
MTNSRTGFTLVELAIVISIIGLLGLLIVPNIVSTTEKWILESAAQEMLQDIRTTQQLAVTSGYEHSFQLNATQNRYRIRHVSSTKPTIKEVEMDKRIKVRVGGDGFVVFGDYRVLSYKATGSPERTGTIYLSVDSGHSVAITVMLNTGRAVIVR